MAAIFVCIECPIATGAEIRQIIVIVYLIFIIQAFAVSPQLSGHVFFWAISLQQTVNVNVTSVIRLSPMG